MRITGILLFVLCVLASFESKAQLITVTPSLPTDIDGVEIIFDASQGSGGLAGYSGDVYAHTGVITNVSTGTSDWKYVKSDWGVNIPDCKLTSLGNNKWKLVISPSIRQYYGVPASEQIEKLAFVFRSGVQVNGSWLEGKTSTNGDIFYDVYPSGISIKITNPDQDLIFASIGQPFSVAVSSVQADTTILFVDGQRVATTTGTTLNHSITPFEYGRFLVKAIAKNSTEQKVDSFYYYVRSEPVVASLPAGITDGINYIGSDSVVLCLYAPLKQYAFVLGDFNNWLADESFYMYKTPDGKRYWCPVGNLVPGKEYVFQYLVDGTIRIGDPYASKVSDPWNDKYIDETTYPGLIPYPSGKTTGVATVLQTNQSSYTWQNNTFVPASNTDLIVYELLIRDFTDKHSFQSVIDTLGYLKRMGVNAIEFMPLNEFEGNLSWGYNPNYYLALDKYYGTSNKFKEMVDKCHDAGIAVFMDIALNHSFGTSPYVLLYWDQANSRPSAESPFYNTVAKHDFNVGFDMNHESADSKLYVSRILKHWLTEYRVDGFRFDLSKGFTQNNTLGNTGAWGQYDASRISILSQYNDSIHAVKPSAKLILEHFANNDEEKVLAAKGMMLWGNINNNYSEAAMGYTPNSDLSWSSYISRGWSAPNLVAFMESHDEERQMYKCLAFGNNNGSYNIKDTTTAIKRAALTATFFFTIPGPKMIWQFGEQGYDYSINYPSGTSASRLDNKPPRWDYMSQGRRIKLYNTYSGLIHLRTGNPLFQTNNFTLDVAGSMKKIKMKRDNQSAIVIGNFGVQTANATPGFYATGTWYDYLTGDSLVVTDMNASISLEPGEARLYMNTYVANPYGFQDYNETSQLTVTIAPNPMIGEGKIMISHPGSNDWKVRVTDLNGRIIIPTITGKFETNVEIPLHLNAKGTYLVRVQVGKEVIVKKVTVL